MVYSMLDDFYKPHLELNKFASKLHYFEEYILASGSRLRRTKYQSFQKAGEYLKDRYIQVNGPELVKRQYQLYKEEGKYKNQGEFIKAEIAPTQKNHTVFYQDLINGRIKDITEFVPNIAALPLSQEKLAEIEDDFSLNYLNVIYSLNVGSILVEHQGCYNLMLRVFSSFKESGEAWKDLRNLAKKIQENVGMLSNSDNDKNQFFLKCYEFFLDLNIIYTEENFLNSYIVRNYKAILKDSYKSAKKNNVKPFNQALFMKNLDPKGDSWKKDSEWEDYYRNIYHQFVNGDRIPDANWLKGIRNLLISLPKNETEHSKEAYRYKEIKSALEMGATALNNIPNLIYPILRSMEKINHECSEEQYLKLLSKELVLRSDEMYQELIDGDYYL